MSWTYEFAPSARKDLRKLERPVIERIRAALDRLVETGQGDVKRLTAADGDLRLRVGDWRIRYERDDAAQLIRILWVRRRREDTYRD